MTRRAPRWVGALALAGMMALLATAASAQRPGSPAVWLARLPAMLEALPNTEADVQRLVSGPAPQRGIRYVARPSSRYPCTLPSGARGTCSALAFAIELDPPVRASAVARALGLTEPRIVSGDVHQRSWSIVETRPFRDGILAAQTPTYGAWQVSATTARPGGPLPTDRVGPSPAYPAGGHDLVSRIEISLDLSAPHPGVPPRATP